MTFCTSSVNWSVVAKPKEKIMETILLACFTLQTSVWSSNMRHFSLSCRYLDKIKYWLVFTLQEWAKGLTRLTFEAFSVKQRDLAVNLGVYFNTILFFLFRCIVKVKSSVSTSKETVLFKVKFICCLVIQLRHENNSSLVRDNWAQN